MNKANRVVYTSLGIILILVGILFFLALVVFRSGEGASNVVIQPSDAWIVTLKRSNVIGWIISITPLLAGALLLVASMVSGRSKNGSSENQKEV